jgi:hypothetical protein
MQVEISEVNFKNAFRFYWEGKKFLSLNFQRLLSDIQKLTPEINSIMQTITESEVERMKIALSDSYRTIPVAARMCGLDKAMVRRLAENGTLHVLKKPNPYYKSSAPMTLVRISELKRWQEENPAAVNASKRTLERAERAKQTLEKRRMSEMMAQTKKVMDLLLKYEEAAVKDPIPLLFILLKLLQIKSWNTNESRTYFHGVLFRGMKLANPEDLQIRQVLDAKTIETIQLCESCSKIAYFLGMTDEEYTREVGKCSKCTTTTEIKEIGKHFEVVFKEGPLSIIFVVDKDFLKNSIHSFLSTLPSSFVVSYEIGNFWDRTKPEQIKFNVNELREKIEALLINLENKTINLEAGRSYSQ